MASSKKGKKTKGVTVALNEFLGDAPAPLPVPRKTLWSDEVYEDNAPSMQMYLPTAPRAARGTDIDEAKIPKNGPYIAYISNLPYDIEEKDITDFFKGLTISSIRLPKDDRTGRQKGFGYVEFSDRSGYISALQNSDTSIKGRRIRVEIADNNDNSGRRGGMQRDNRDSNYDPDRTSGDWRSGPRQESFASDDRRGPRRDFGGYNRDREDRGNADRDRDMGSNWRDAPRRAMPEEPRSSYSGGPRRNYGGSGPSERERESEPRVRPKLVLEKRTLPIEPIQIREETPPKEEEPPPAPRPPKPSAASIFGGAKPVDTAAREREIEERLAKDRPQASDLPRTKTEGRAKTPERKEAPPPVENAWNRRAQRPDASKESDDDGPTRRLEEDSRRSESESDRPERNRSERNYDQGRDEDRSRNYNRDRDYDKPRDYGRDSRPRDIRERDRYDHGRGYNRDRPSYRDSDRPSYRDSDRPSYRDSDRPAYRESDRDHYNRERDHSREYDKDKASYRDSERERTHGDDDVDSNKNREREGETLKDRPQDGEKERRAPVNNKSLERDGKERDKRVTRPNASPVDTKEKSKEPRPPRESSKIQEPVAPNFVASNKFTFLDEDDASD